MSTELIDPASINYPDTPAEQQTFARLRMRSGSMQLTPKDVELIEAARAKRRLRGRPRS